MSKKNIYIKIAPPATIIFSNSFKIFATNTSYILRILYLTTSICSDSRQFVQLLPCITMYVRYRRQSIVKMIAVYASNFLLSTPPSPPHIYFRLGQAYHLSGLAWFFQAYRMVTRATWDSWRWSDICRRISPNRDGNRWTRERRARPANCCWYPAATGTRTSDRRQRRKWPVAKTPPITCCCGTCNVEISLTIQYRRRPAFVRHENERHFLLTAQCFWNTITHDFSRS